MTAPSPIDRVPADPVPGADLLIFGAGGQLGRALLRLAPGARAPGRAEADLTDPEACARLIAQSGAAAVINAAAFTAVDAAETDAATAHAVNAEAPGAMARACAARGLPFVHVSTDYVFDGSGTRPWRPDDIPAPLNAYGRGKLAGEGAVAAAGGAWAVLRSAWVFSAEGGDFVSAMLRLGAARDRIEVVEDQVGGPTPAADLARACLVVATALARDPSLSGVYHFAGAPDVSRADFARAIMDRAGLGCAVAGIPSSAWPAPAARPLNSRLDCRATRAAFGLSPPDWRAGLDTVLATAHESPTP